MRFSLSATTALLLQVSTSAGAASTSSSSFNFLDAFEFGRSPPIQRKRNLVIQTTERRMSKAAKAEVESSPSLGDAKASKTGYRLMPKAAKVSAKVTTEVFSVDTIGSMFVEPLRTTKADKWMMESMSYSFDGLEFSMPSSFFSMSVDTTSAPTSTPTSVGGGGGGDDGDGGGGSPPSASPPPTPSPTPPGPSNDFHEVVFKYLSVCSGVELEMNCLTKTAIDALMAAGEATARVRARRFLGTDATLAPSPVNTRPEKGSKSSKSPSLSPSVIVTPPTVLETSPPTTKAPVTSKPSRAPTQAPVTPAPTQASVTPAPTQAPVTPAPTQAPVTPAPTKASVTPSPTKASVTPLPTQAPVTSAPTKAPVTPSPTQAPVKALTLAPTSAATLLPTSTPTEQCRPEVTDDDLLSILTTSKQQCIDSGNSISDATFQSALSSFLAIFDESNTCWDTLCGDSDITSDLFFQILFEEASECADVTLSVDDCILDHILDVVFQSHDTEDGGSRVRRSLQESCCESAPTESDLNFYANYLLLSADAACAEQGSVGINDEEWNTATNDLVKLFGATQCWGVEPCEEEDAVSEEVPPPSPADENVALSEDTPPYYDGPTLSEDGQVCIMTTGISPEETRSLELFFYYQVETKSDSLDLGLVERALIEKICDDAGDERRLNELETEVVAVDGSPEDVVSKVYTCTPDHPDANCQVINGAITILLHGPITPNEESYYLSKISSLFPLHMNGTNISSMTYPEEITKSKSTHASSSPLSVFGITAAATAFLTIALFARGVTKRVTTDSSKEEEEYKGHDELTIAGTAEMTIVEESSEKHHVVNEVEREHWRELGMGHV